jgi:hypothetical protein
MPTVSEINQKIDINIKSAVNNPDDKALYDQVDSNQSSLLTSNTYEKKPLSHINSLKSKPNQLSSTAR